MSSPLFSNPETGISGIEIDQQCKGQLSHYTDPITSLRGLLALAIVWHHLYPEPIAGVTSFGKIIYTLISCPGRISVWLFFVISGYSIIYGFRMGKYSLALPDTPRFYFNRGIRILPLFYVTVLLQWIAYIYLHPGELPPVSDIFRSIFFLDFNMRTGIYTFTPTWVIAITVHFYIFAPFLVRGYMCLLKKTGLTIAFLLLIPISVACNFLGRWLGSPDLRNIVGCLPLFLFGFFAFDFHMNNRKILGRILNGRARAFVYLALFIFFEAAFFLYRYRSDRFFEYQMEIYIGALGAILIATLLGAEKAPNQTTAGTDAGNISLSFRWIGQQSYGLYLWHSVVMALFMITGFFRILSYPHSSLLFMPVTFIDVSLISLMISYVFYSILEEPYHRLYKKRQH